MFALLSGGLGLLAADAATAPAPCGREPDPRHAKLADFFRARKSPLDRYAGEFLSAADVNGLDWRLLPSIAMVESSGGKYYRGNNVFGWNSGNARFKSIPHGIHYVAARLAVSPYYAGKDLRLVLATYNPALATYPDHVFRYFDVLAER